MSSAQTGGPRRGVPAPAGRITEVAVTARGLDVTFRLKNDADRAVHYIADVRTIRFDPGIGRLVVGLSDEGRVLLPSMANIHPNFKVVDPGSEAELKLTLPLQIRKLADAPAPDGSVAFESQDLTSATEIVVEVAWSDTPFYGDPRPTDTERMPTEAWALGKVVMAAAGPGKPRGDEPVREVSRS